MRAGITMYALSGVDVALWDLMGKALGVSTSRLLGGWFREEGAELCEHHLRYGGL